MILQLHMTLSQILVCLHQPCCDVLCEGCWSVLMRLCDVGLFRQRRGGGVLPHPEPRAFLCSIGGVGTVWHHHQGTHSSRESSPKGTCTFNSLGWGGEFMVLGNCNCNWLLNVYTYKYIYFHRCHQRSRQKVATHKAVLPCFVVVTYLKKLMVVTPPRLDPISELLVA